MVTVFLAAESSVANVNITKTEKVFKLTADNAAL